MDRLTNENQRLTALNVNLSAQVENLKIKLKNEVSKYRILAYNITNVSQARSSIFGYKKKIKRVLQNVNLELKKLKYRFEEITIKNILNDSDNKPFKIKYSNGSETTTVDRCLFYKDKVSLADHRYFKFRKGMGFKKNMVPLTHIKKRKLEIKRDTDIQQLSTGYYINPIRYMKICIQKYLIKHSEQSENKIWIKLSCDGTKLSKNVIIVNFVFSIINEKLKAASVTGCYRIGAFKITKENYNAINGWLPELWRQINNFRAIIYNTITHEIMDISSQPLQNAQIGEKKYEIEYFFSADYKMMLIVLGLKAANSSHGCFMCKQNKDNYHKIGKYFLFVSYYFIDFNFY
jgi:hypothetical protein